METIIMKKTYKIYVDYKLVLNSFNTSNKKREEIKSYP